ncbi:4Fe-4S binding protein [Clostridium sp. cel8]|jgi:polyferredoxin/major membrane immunogen (membrane-anchored lipoprotein)|uniref:4Fe-4S binding protein n=1 Tax=unclassified Clostridium TaxID=2614128 RepID=UPI0015F68E7C|nr:4Fe-4S binding protein [Clostridium sp. cel8]MBA5850813.1 4Fe-4S binding protein [Clostridium sp. cel8]
MKNSLKRIEIFRRIVQIALFILLPGMYILAFSELKLIFEMIANGNFSFIQSFPQLTELTLTVIFTILMGRFFCGWMCAFGTFTDWIYIISKKFFKINFKINSKIDNTLKYVKYIILFLTLILIFKGGISLNSFSPWNAFAQIIDFKTVISSFTVGFILLILIVIGSIFIERFFCRYLCPLGALFSLISRISLFKIKKPVNKCGKCRICTNNCPMGLKLYDMTNVHGGECISCLKCVENCPRENPSTTILDHGIPKKIIISFAIAIFAVMYGLSTFIQPTINQSESANTNKIVSNSNLEKSQDTKYKDGTYMGEGTGFRGGTTEVSVTIDNGKITNIETVSTEDTPRFYQYVENTIPNEIISNQSTSVDTVSGATYSSNGLIEAVKNALIKASE